jgi:hypothetical protein
MKLIKLTGKLILILILTVSVLLFAASFLMQQKVGDLIITSLNRNIAVRLETGSFHLSFLRKFPKASLELKKVLVHSSAGFDRKSFGAEDTDTLLFAESVFMEFRITDIIHSNYNIEAITAKKGLLRLLSDTTGRVNYEISKPGGTQEGDAITIDLQKIILDDLNASYNNLATELIINSTIRNSRLKSRISGNNIDFSASGDLLINSFKLYNTVVSHPLSTTIDLSLQSNKDGITFNKGSLAIDDYNFELNGHISADNVLDLNVSGKNIDLANILTYLPDKYREKAASYRPSGKTTLSCSIKGPVTRTRNPHVEINCSLAKGQIIAGNSDVSISELSFSGHYTNGSANRLSTSSASIRDVSFNFGGSEYKGELSISDFSHPHTNISFSGKLFPSQIRDFFHVEGISEASGYAEFDLRLDTHYWPVDSIRTGDLIDLKPSGSLNFHSLNLGLVKNNLLVKEVNGTVFLSDFIKASGMSFEYEDQKISVDGDFRNLPEWLAKRPVNLVVNADIAFDRFIPGKFTKDATGDSKNKQYVSADYFPMNMLLDVNLSTGAFEYNKFSASDIMTSLNYKPGYLTVKSLQMKTLEGNVSGTGFVIRNPNGSMVSKGNFEVSGINVKKAFTTFNNFGQSFIQAENLSGILSGTVSVLVPMDAYFKPRISSISAEGKYILENGALVSFEPVRQLSSFIELSELENIHFEKLENDFFIRNNTLFIPQMDVRSSAADLTVNGQHSFDDKYEYHVKMLLSQILSKKRKKNNVSEFGVVKDDGLGRTSLLLKVENKGDEMKVGYDLKAATQGVKNNLKEERKTLRTILNQEYGWYKDDPEITKKAAEKKPAFSITWEEADTVPAAEPAKQGRAKTKSVKK